MLKLFATLSNI